jgi:hypothetical protein
MSAYRHHPEIFSPDDRLAMSGDKGRQQIPASADGPWREKYTPVDYKVDSAEKPHCKFRFVSGRSSASDNFHRCVPQW